MSISPLKRVQTDADAGRGICRVFIRDMEVLCLVGVHGFEREAAQRVRINIDMGVRENATPLGDDITNVVCYEDIADGVREIATACHVNLVETMAENIAVYCLGNPRVESVRVRVEKPDVFDDAASVGVEIERLRAPHD